MSWSTTCSAGCAWLLLASGCARPQLAGFIPRLELTVSAVRSARAADGAEHAADRERWHARGVVFLSFRTAVQAAYVPTRLELGSLEALTPCAEDDVTCLQEAAEMQAELASALEDLP